MSAALDMIQQAGITVEVKHGGKLVLRGLASLPEEQARDIVVLARANKGQIIADIADVCPYSAEYLARAEKTYPHLVCCPLTKPAWWWRHRKDCEFCRNGSCREKVPSHAG